MNKKMLIGIFLLFLIIPVFAGITNFSVSPSIRLGEKLTITGIFDTPNVLCKAIIFDANNDGIERLSDEYTFVDGSFYFERTMIEPPYYRGDDFNAVITCGSGAADISSGIFTVFQPTSLAHPIQQNWAFIFDQNNLDALAILGAFIFLIIFFMVIGAVIIKKIKGN